MLIKDSPWEPIWKLLPLASAKVVAASATCRSTNSAFDGWFNHSLSHSREFHLSDSARIPCRLHLNDALGVEIVLGGLGRRLFGLDAENLQHLRQRRDALVFRPGSYLLH
ncbi:hypothetical protein ACLB90_03195 [Stenotrophomonas sp. LGBM10]|uniref:hypothetical protein n=1 Tax=Stenotrophomonas sp. LGBM10 TaxID=3390038 RepID=UPI00398B074C